jgi:hypothetical protein
MEGARERNEYRKNPRTDITSSVKRTKINQLFSEQMGGNRPRGPILDGKKKKKKKKKKKLLIQLQKKVLYNIVTEFRMSKTVVRLIQILMHESNTVHIVRNIYLMFPSSKWTERNEV